ncbi:MAG: HepT-like ribonuclease domain-containing protein [Halobacteria archaeon]
MLERIARYRDKINYIAENLELIKAKPESELEKSGVFYCLHTSIEAAMDLAAMAIRDMGRKVEDDYANIEILKNSGLISSELAMHLKKCNGLRNYLVHRYNEVDEQIALENVDFVKKTMYSFLDAIEGFLDELRVD